MRHGFALSTPSLVLPRQPESWFSDCHSQRAPTAQMKSETTSPSLTLRGTLWMLDPKLIHACAAKEPPIAAREPADAGLPLVALGSLAAQESTTCDRAPARSRRTSVQNLYRLSKIRSQPNGGNANRATSAFLGSPNVHKGASTAIV
jgi:hypothetical protein